MSGLNSNEVSPATLEIDIPPFAVVPSPENLSSKVVDALEREKFEHKKSIDHWGVLFVNRCHHAVFCDVCYGKTDRER